MENAEALKVALQKLAQRRATIGADLQRERAELAALDAQIQDLQGERDRLQTKIIADQKAYEKMDVMITQTEEGYRQMLDTAQTLMDVVAMQMPDL